jgi:hypothetical protein
MQDILKHSGCASHRVISSIVIPATGRSHYTRPDAASTALLYLDTLLAVARHPGLARLVIPRLDRQSLDRANATSSTPVTRTTTTTTTTMTTENQRLFASLRHLETSMLAAAATSLVACLDGPGQQPGTTGEKRNLQYGAILTSLRVNIVDDAPHTASDGACSVITPVVRALGQLRSLRVLVVRFAAILCPFTAQHLDALNSLVDLRELSITFGATVGRPAASHFVHHRLRSCYRLLPVHGSGTTSISAGGAAALTASCPMPFSDDELLAFVATQPGLRSLELLTPMAVGRSAGDWCRSGPDFLALLAESCPRLECLKLTMLCRLDALASSSRTAPPAFPALQCLGIDIYTKWYVTLLSRQSCFLALADELGLEFYTLSRAL